MEYRNVATICPYCGTGCGLFLQVLDGQVVGVIPNKENPVNEGRLCIKGWNAHSFIHHPDRLTVPLIKREGEFAKATWEEALNLVAEKLALVKASYGPDSIAILSSAKATNEENYLLQKFARAVLGTNNIDHCARLCHASTVVGLAASFGSGAMTNSIPDLEEADCILITGSNTTEQHPIIGERLLHAKARGAKLIVVDPRRIQMARLADLHLRQRPGSDIAWLNGMMNIIIAEGLENKEFIASRTEGFAEFRQAVAEYTPERAEAISGIPKEDLAKAARIFAQAERAALVYSMGITQHSDGVQKVQSCANLALLTGNIGRPGSGVNPLRGQNNVQGGCDMGALPNIYPGYQAVTDPQVRARFQEAWGVEELPQKVGLTVVEMTNAVLAGKVRAMYIMGENPVLSDPDVNHVVEALERLDFLVVQDIFLSETAQLADVVLPAASFAERDGTFTATDRRVQLIRPAIPPIGESRPDWRIICDLAQALGAKGFAFSSPAEVMEELARLTPSYGGVSHERLKELGYLQWPCRNAADSGTPYLHKGNFSRGLGKFHAIHYKPPAEEPDAEYPFLLTTGRSMFHYHTGTMTRRSPKLAQEVAEAYVELNPEDARELGLDRAGRVRLTSRRGQIEVRALLTSRVPKGLVFAPFHFAEAPANALTNPALDPIAKIPELKVCAVRVEAV